MGINQAASQGVHVYQIALKRHIHEDEAYIMGLDFIIDKIFHDPNIGTTTLKAVRLYERQVLGK